MPEPRRRLAGIMFTDMVGYSKLAQSDEAAALALLQRHNTVLREVFGEFRGREIKTVGDAFLVEFDSALEAVRCAIDIQRVLHDQEPANGARISVRIGIHIGDVVESADDVLGDAVNIASRIEPLAEPGGICVSQQVVDQVRNKLGIPVLALPPVALKNIQTPIPVYRLLLPWDPRSSASPASPPPSEGRAMAVLPLANISPDPNDAYFADGLTEELITSLSQLQGLSVIARTSVMGYKNAPKTIREIGGDLHVDTVLEGSVRKAGNRIRITLQLIDVPTQRHVWATSYNRELDDVFAVQSDIAERTASALRLKLSRDMGSGRPRAPTQNLEAYDLYLRGLAASSDQRDPLRKEAFQSFEAATRVDPEFADAYAAWADLFVSLASDYLPMREVMPRARELAARALELDPDSSDAHSALGNIAMQFDHDWVRMGAEFRRAIALNPSNVRAHRYFGLGLLTLGRSDEAQAEIREAVRLDPTGMHEATLAWGLAESGDTEGALRAYHELLRARPDELSSHTYLGMFYAKLGRLPEATREAESTLPPRTGIERFDHALLNAVVGRPAAALAILAEADRGATDVLVTLTDRAMVYSAMGETDRAIELLERDYREGDMVLWLFYRGVFFDPIRDDPRFIALLRAYGVPPVPRGHPRPGDPAR